MHSTRIKLTAVATSAAVLAGGAGVVLNASAADSSKSTTKKAAAAKKAKGPGARFARHAVHADFTIATKDGFKTVTIDRGTVKSVNGNQLTVEESTKKLTGKIVALTIPDGAKVRVDKKAAQLSDVKAGQHVNVIVGPKQTHVVARDAK
jgi:hypothetical protein